MSVDCPGAGGISVIRSLDVGSGVNASVALRLRQDIPYRGRECGMSEDGSLRRGSDW